MKMLIAIFVAAGIGFAAAYVVVSSNASVHLRKEREAFEAEKARLEVQLSEAQKRASGVRTIEVPATGAPAPARLTPQEILDRLLQIHPGSGTNRTRAIRLVVFYLESLTECGQPALPVIANFFERSEDVDYSIDEAGGGQGGRGSMFAFRRGQQLRTDFVLPPSLRLGLVDVVAQIGGEQAEKILASVLSTTGRGVEVAYLARKLETIVPGKYRDLAISAAIDLLTNPIAVDNPDRLDQNARAYLFSVLEMYNDTSFIATAQKQLINPNGAVDRDALDYLTRVLKDQSVSALYAAYKDSRMTNFMDRAQLATQMLNYTGQNPQADTLFKEIVTDTNVNNGARMFAIMRLAGMGGGPGGGGQSGGSESPTDPQVITARMKLLESVAATVTDERMTQVILATGQNLQNLLEGKPVEYPNPFGGGGRGQRGQRGLGGQGGGMTPGGF